MAKRIGDVFLVVLGSLVMGFGIALAVNAGFGLDPLSAFNSGISQKLGISIGSAAQVLMITILVILFWVDRKRVGWGSVINGVMVGAFTDMFMPFAGQLKGDSFFNFFILLLGLISMSVGIGTYVSAHLGEAGIDAIMILAAEKFHKNVNTTRIIMDILLAAAGFLLGGQIGIGTLFAMFINGPIIQATTGIIHRLRVKKLIWN